MQKDIMTGLGSPDADLADILATLGSKTTGNTDRCDAYAKFTRHFKEDEVCMFGLDVSKNISSVLKVIQTDMLSSSADVCQGALQVLGVCLHDSDIVRSMTKEAGSQILKSLCTCVVKSEEKNSCTRALWCVGKQNLPDDVVRQQLQPLLEAVEHAMEKWGGQSVTVEHESVNTIARLTEQAPKEMSPESVRWAKVLLQLVSHTAIKVRERVLSVVENSSNLMVTNRKELVTVVMPVFKTKVIPELKKLLSNKNEIYVLKCWGILVQIFGEELHHGSTINHILPVVELGFKSLSPDVKIAAFYAWQQLIDNFATNPNILGDPKRIKLVMQVFKINNAKVENVALVKLKVWWHFVWLLGNKISSNFDMVAAPLLQFCVGGTKLGEHGASLTPRVMKNGASPVTPRMNLINANNQWPLFQSLQLHGCEILAHFVGTIDEAVLSSHNFYLDTLRHEVVTGPSFFIKHSPLFMMTATELFVSLGKDVPECLVLHVWQWLIAHLQNAIDSPAKLDIRETLTTFLSQFQVLVLSRVHSSSLILQMFQHVCRLPKKVLCSTAYNVKGGEMVNGTPALFLTELLLTPTLLQSCTGMEMYHNLLTTIIHSGTGNSTCTLGFLQSLLQILETNAQFVDNRESVWRLWSAVVNPLLEHITKTNEVNQGDSLEHNFSCTIHALTLPLSQKLAVMPQPSVKALIRTWTDLYKTVNRLAAMVTNAEANVICEDVCQRIMDIDKVADKMEHGDIDLQIHLCHVVVSCLDFSSMDSQSAFNLSSSPKKWTRRRQRPLENIHSFVHLLAQLQNKALELTTESDQNKKPGSFSVQGMFNNLVDVFSSLFTHVTSSTLISNLVVVLAQPIGRLYAESAKKSSVKVYNNSFLQKLEKLWMDICTCLQSRYTSLFDSDFLHKLSPLLESTFLHSRRQIKNQTMGLWNSTFSNAVSLDYPEPLKPILGKVKEKSLIQLPGWVQVTTTVIEETPISQMSQSQAPEPRIPGMPSPHKIHGSFLNKAVSPNVKSSPLRAPMSPKLTASAKKKALGFDGFDDKDFVVIKSSPKKKMALTSHQREVMKEKRVFPAMYNSLEISQDASLMAAHFSTDTQMEGTMSGTPTPTGTQPFSLFGSIIPPTVEQFKEKSKTKDQKSADDKVETTNTLKTRNRREKSKNSKSPEIADEDSKSSRRKSVRFTEQNKKVSTKSKKGDVARKIESKEKSVKTVNKDDVIVIDSEIDSQDEGVEEIEIDKTAIEVKDNLTKECPMDIDDVTDKEPKLSSSDKDAPSFSSLPQNALGVLGFTPLSSTSKSSQSKSSNNSDGIDAEEADRPETSFENKISQSEVKTLGPVSQSDSVLKNIDISCKTDGTNKECVENEINPSSQPLFSWTQKLSELRNNSPVGKTLYQEVSSPGKRSPGKSPRKNSKKKPVDENDVKGALDKWIIRSPVKVIDFSDKPKMDLVVGSVLSGTVVEETQSPTKFFKNGKHFNGHAASIMETPPKHVLESLPVGHANSNRKLFNSQNGNVEHELDLVEDSNFVPCSPNAKSFTIKTGTPVLKIKKLTDIEIKRYSPSKSLDTELDSRAKKQKKDEIEKVKSVVNISEIKLHDESSHEHDDFSEFKPLDNDLDQVGGDDFFSKTLTDTEQAMLKVSDSELNTEPLQKNKMENSDQTEKSHAKDNSSEKVVDSAFSPSLFSQDTQIDSGNCEKLDVSSQSSSEYLQDESQEVSVGINMTETSEHEGRHSGRGRKRKQLTPKKMSPEDSKLEKKRKKGNSIEKETGSARKLSKRLKERRDKDENKEKKSCVNDKIQESDVSTKSKETEKNENDSQGSNSSQQNKKGKKQKSKVLNISDSVLESKKAKSNEDSDLVNSSGVEPVQKNLDEKELISAPTLNETQKINGTEQTANKNNENNIERMEEDEQQSTSDSFDGTDCVVIENNEKQGKKRKGKKEKKKMHLKKECANSDISNMEDDKIVESEIENKEIKIDKDGCQKEMSGFKTSSLEKEQNNGNDTNYDAEKKKECNAEIEIIEQKTPESRNSSKQPERRSTTKHKKEIALQKVLQRAKDLNGADSKTDINESFEDDDLPLIDIKKKLAENLEKKMEENTNESFTELKKNVDPENATGETEKNASEFCDNSESIDTEKEVKLDGIEDSVKDMLNGILENEDKCINLDKPSNLKIRSKNLDETPKKGFKPSSQKSNPLFLKTGMSDSKLILGSRKFEQRKKFARRSILKPASVGSSAEDGSPKRVDFHPIKIGRIYSPTASPSASILKKRQLIIDTDSDTNSPPSKQRRVSFADPVEDVKMSMVRSEVARPPSPLITDKQFTALSSSSSTSQDAPSCKSTCDDTQQSAETGYQSTQESQLNTTEPVCPELIDCGQSVEKILPQLTSSIWSRGLGQLVRARNIHTIGDLSSLTETDIHSLPIRSPKIQTVRKALGKFGKNLQLKTAKLRGSPKPPAADSKQKEDKDAETKDIIEVKDTEPLSSDSKVVNEDNEVRSADIGVISASSADLLDEVGKLSRNINQSQSKEESMECKESLEDSGITPNKLMGSNFLDSLTAIYHSSKSENLERLRTEQLFQAHQYLTEIKDQVFNSLKTRCHSPPTEATS